MKTIILNQQTGQVNNKHQLITLPAVKSQKPGMKKRFLIATAIIGLLMSGCLVKSLHPFYTESDIVFRKDILGTYTDQDKGTWSIESKEEKGMFGKGKSDKPTKFYLLKLIDEKNKTVTLKGCLFKLDNDYYVDFYPESGNNDDSQTDLYNFHVLGVHTVAKVLIAKNELRIKWYSEEWLGNLFKENKIRLAHENTESDNIVLTASTQELQKFMRKFANDPKAFKKEDDKNIEYILTRK